MSGIIQRYIEVRHLFIESVPITTKVVNLILALDEVGVHDVT